MIISGPGVRSVQFELAHTGEARQQAAAGACVGRWRRLRWPGHLLGVSCLTSVDGASVLACSQWAEPAEPRSLWGLDGAPGYSAGPRRYHRLDQVGRASVRPVCFALTTFGRVSAALDWLASLLERPGAACGHLFLRDDGGFLGVSGWAGPVEGGFTLHARLGAPVSVMKGG